MGGEDSFLEFGVDDVMVATRCLLAYMWCVCERRSREKAMLHTLFIDKPKSLASLHMLQCAGTLIPTEYAL
jgi:hypothetical protein